MKNMTALMSYFVRYYYTKNNKDKVYEEKVKLLSDEEYKNIEENLSNGIKFFNSLYDGSDPVSWIVNNQLGPSVIARSVISEELLLESIRKGCKQYLILASGYDTSFSKVNKSVKVYEVDKEEIIEDKERRIKLSHANNSNVTYINCDFNSEWINNIINTIFNKNEFTFCSLLGISYYLDKEIFGKTIELVSSIIGDNSYIVFDYPINCESEKEKLNKKLAAGANEEMKSNYSINDIECIAKKANLKIYKNYTYKDINDRYFYNQCMKAPVGVNYCVLVKNNNEF